MIYSNNRNYGMSILVMKLLEIKKLSAKMKYVKNVNMKDVLLTFLSMILIAMANNVNPNPGPDSSTYPCGTCDKPVTWDDRGIVCDTCIVTNGTM